MKVLWVMLQMAGSSECGIMTNTTAWTLTMTTNHGYANKCFSVPKSLYVTVSTNAQSRNWQWLWVSWWSRTICVCVCVFVLQGWRAVADQCRGGRPWLLWRLMSGDSVSSSCCTDAGGRGCEHAGEQRWREITIKHTSKMKSSAFIKSRSGRSYAILITSPTCFQQNNAAKQCV